MFNLRMPKKLNKGTLVLFLLGAAITGFTSLKTIDLLKYTMSTDQQSFAWFGWACFEIGLLAWIYWHGAGARRDQRTIAEFMIAVDLLAVVAAFVADTILVQAQKGGIQVDGPTLTWSIIIAVCIVAVANLSAIVGTKMLDPETRKRVKQEEYQEALEEAQEEAEHAIEIERLKYISKNATAIAPHIGYQQGMDWTQQMYQRWALPGQQQPASLPTPAPLPDIPYAKDVENGAPSIFGNYPEGYPAALRAWQAQQQASTPETNVLDIMSSGTVDKEKMTELIELAVEYGQLTKEQAAPLLKALTIQAKSQSNGIH